MSADTNLMPIPGPVDPVPVPRKVTARADGRVSVAARMVRTERRHLGRLLKRYQIAAERVRS
jgi:DNA-binding NtrC family response regulator